MLKKIQNLLTNTCILFTLFVFILYSAGRLFLSEGSIMTLEKAPLLFVTCFVLCLLHRILYIKRLPPMLRILLHYFSVLGTAFLLFSVFAKIISTSFAALLLLSLITLLYCAITLIFTFLRNGPAKKAEEEYTPMFKE